MLDIDADKGGFISWDELQAEHGQVESCTVTTGGGGQHCYFQRTTDARALPCRAEFRAGLDFRGDGGYVVAPPSTHISGRTYEWRMPWDVRDIDTVRDESYEPKIPGWLESVVLEKLELERDVKISRFSAEVAEWGGDIPESVASVLERDDRLAKLFKRDKRFKLEGGDPSKLDFAIACALYEGGVLDRRELAFGLMASRHQDPEAWVERIQKGTPNYYADTAAKAIANVEKQRAETERAKRETHSAWQKNFPMNELGDTKRFLEIHGSELVYHVVERRWHVWDGAQYAGDDDRTGGNMGIDSRLQTYLREMPVIQKFQNTQDARDAWFKYALKHGTSGHLESLKRLCRTSCARSESDLDAHPFLLNAANGIIDLESGDLWNHDRKYLQTRILGCPYIPSVQSDLWLEFLEQVLPDDSVREFFGLSMGYSVLGIQPEQRFFFVWGPAASGKSTALKAIQSALGTYHRAADFSTFLQQGTRQSSAPSSDLARLARVRVVSAVEVGHGQQLAAGLIKQLSGGDLVTARKLYGDEQEFAPTMALWLVANDRPKGRVDDDALWRRLVPIEFDQVFAEGQRDGRLTEKLTRPQERIGVLTWIVENAMKYLDLKKLELPARCREGIESYKRHSNPVQSWIEEKLVLDPLGRVQTSAAWDDYRAWCNANEERSVRKGNFREILDSLFERGRINGYDNWHGVRRVEEYQQPANFE